jgi:hypothetical protein
MQSRTGSKDSGKPKLKINKKVLRVLDADTDGGTSGGKGVGSMNCTDPCSNHCTATLPPCATCPWNMCSGTWGCS